MQPKASLVGIVIKEDGTIPFDLDCSPTVRAHVIEYLTSKGHELLPISDTKHLKIKNYRK